MDTPILLELDIVTLVGLTDNHEPPDVVAVTWSPEVPVILTFCAAGADVPS